MEQRTPINVTDLDFDGIKTSLKNFLKTKNSPIKDYNYEGSTFNILLDVLAANTHYNSLYSNFIANEMFLDSALMRSSVVSIAKELGYVPKSAKLSTATITISVSPQVGGDTTLVIPSNTKFNTLVNDTIFSYINTNDEYLEWNGSAYTGTINVVCGDIYTQELTWDGSSSIYIDADGVDTETLSVQVQNSSTDLRSKAYSYFAKMLDITAESYVYFLNETDLKRYELRFGDGILGKQIISGNIVKLKYVAVNPDAPYGATNFVPNSDFYSGYTVDIVCVYPSSQVSDVESVDSIKRNITRYNQSQERSVISADYEYHIQQAFPEVTSVVVWGGEDNNPPQYGKVFASCIMQDMNIIPQSKKLKIAEEIKKRSTINIRPTIVDPEYMYIIVGGFVRYKADRIGMSAAELKNQIVAAITSYSTEKLENFNSLLSFSNISADINNIDPAISSVVFNFRLSHDVRLDPVVPLYVTKQFNNSIKEGDFISTRYYINGNVTDAYQIEDYNGVLNEYHYPDNIETNKTFSRTVGTINYSTGEVVLEAIKGEAADGSAFINFSFDIESSEVASGFNQILVIDSTKSAVKIEVKPQ